MISRQEKVQICTQAKILLKKSGFAFTDQEYDSLSAADFGLSRLEKEGIIVLTFLNTPFLGAKALILLPGQTMVEHWHPTRKSDPGKEETLRCLWGECYLYIPGKENMTKGYIPLGQDQYYQCRHEITLNPRDQYTLAPGIPHWFQPGPEGTVVLSFSSQVSDQEDLFSNPHVIRKTQYGK